MTFKRKKYIKLLSYIISTCEHKPNLGKTVICNILYFIDFNYYELYQESLTNETYWKTKRGIIPSHFNEITDYLIRNEYLFHRKEEYYNTIINRYYITKIPDVKFEIEELEIINQVIDNLSDFSATKIYQYASRDLPYKVANINEKLNYTYVFYRLSDYSVRKERFK